MGDSTMASVAAAQTRAELKAGWANMLAHQLPVLPPLEQSRGEPPALCAWLEGGEGPPGGP